jgi:urate oxidase
MTIRLGENQYGKSETHMVRVTKGGPDGSVHEIKDINVSIALAGDFAGSHLEGDNANIVPTDTQKNTVYAFAKESPVGEIEEFALRLARHSPMTFQPFIDACSIEEIRGRGSTLAAASSRMLHAIRVGKRPTSRTREQTWVVSGLGHGSP